MNSHTIVYLDQNYLSNMAKARCGRIKDEDIAKFWLSLFDELKKAVLADKIACPELEFHWYEAMYDRRLEEPIREVIDALSWGLKFQSNQSIVESQIEDAAENFIGKQPEVREWWAIAFKSNPRTPVESRMQDIWGSKGRINVHLSLSDEVVEHDRLLKSEFANGAVLPVTRQNTYPHWFELLRREKMSFVVNFFGLRAEATIYQQLCSGSSIEEFIAISCYAELKRLWEKLGGIGISHPTTAANFLKSDELLDILYIDIYCSIHAAIIKHFPNRKRQKGDFYDIPILSTVLPYCAITTTDSFMKEILVNRLHFDDKYNAKIFSATKADRLAFQKFIRGL